MRRGLLACIGASVLLHAALAAWWWAQPGTGTDAARSPAVLQLRMAEGGERPPAAAVERLAAASTPRPRERAFAPGLTEQLGSSAPQPVELLQPLEPLAQTVLAPLGAQGPSLTPDFDEQAYIPRPRLTVVPALRSAVLLSWPPHDAPPAGRYAGVLSLFIDELGVVQRVRVDDGELPAVLQEQARAVFLGAQFSPGQLQGQVVKSRIRVEVSFEADPQAQRKGVSP